MEHLYTKAKAIVLDKKEKYLTYKRTTRKFFWDYFKSWINLVFKYEKLLYFKRIIFTISVVLAIYWPIYYNVQPKIEKEEIIIIEEEKSMDDFLDTLGFIESTNNYKAVNQFGYLGKYQLGEKALNQIGINVSNEEFLNNKELQEIAVKLLLKNNRRTLASYIKKYSTKTIGDVYITESGILGAAHLAPGGVIRFLKSNGEEIFKDSNGVPITKYLKKLSGYKINL